MLFSRRLLLECIAAGAAASVAGAVSLSVLPALLRCCKMTLVSSTVDPSGVARWRYQGIGTVAISSADSVVFENKGVLPSFRAPESQPPLEPAWWTGAASSEIIGQRRDLSVIDYGLGWPIVCLRGYSWAPIRASMFGGENGITWSGAMQIAARSKDDEIGATLVWIPVPTGLVVNGATLGASYGILRCAAACIRRGLRKRRGVCARCGYPRFESRRCPECGG